MIEQNVLLGNGINIEFSENDDYKKEADALLKNMQTQKVDIQEY